MGLNEAFYQLGERAFEPSLEAARNSYFEAADSERTTTERMEAIARVERELKHALTVLEEIRRIAL